MPTVLMVDGHRVMIFADDHGPPHVHVFKAGNEVVFLLNCPSGTPVIRNRKGFTLREANKIEKMLTQHLKQLCEAWEDLHGDDD